MTSPTRARRSPSRRTSRATALAAAAVVVVAGAGAASAATASSSTAVDLGSRPVVIATVGSPGDSATAAGAAARVGAPVLYTTSTSLSPSTRDFLKGYKASSAVLVGGTAAISQGVAKEVDAISGTLHRVQGADKYETAAAVAAFMARVPAAGAAKDGASAYDLWLAAGNKGTTATFLASLRGPQGLQGAAGAAGKDGARGADGLTGKDGAQGAQGEQGVTGQDGAQGAQGEQGLTGQDGAQGEQGLTGKDGAQGEQGAQGAPGPVGPVGPAGAKGDVGATGPAGPQGVKGETGATGATGPAGPAGGAIAGYRVERKSFPLVDQSQWFTGTVSCQPGEQALSGGWDVNGTDQYGWAYPSEAQVLEDGRTYSFASYIEQNNGVKDVVLSVVCVSSAV